MAVEGISESSVTGILKSLGSVVAKHISMAWGTKDAMKELKDKLEMIQAVTHDAEQKQVTNHAVKLWLKQLKEVAYDADDVLDEFSYEVMRQNAKVRVLVPSSGLFFYKMSPKIKDINKRLDDITTRMLKFNLESTDSSVEYDQDTEQQDRMTVSFVGDLKIVGRENDRSHIVNILLSSFSSSENSSPREKINVVSIVGMGGLGKTTLAQSVYKHDSIDRNFKTKAWVCISDNFDIYKILEKILESSTEKKSPSMSNVSVLVREVQELIAGKKYLIVLDDVWNENAEDWDKLMSLLSVGAPGSKILVTTRSDHVAAIVRGTIPPYNLTSLSNHDCWLIIKNKAFSPGGAPETETLTKIGEEIATRCSGLPLAANFLGSLMRLKRKESDWLAIRDNGIFNKPENPNRIIQILKLSFDNLPSHLKQCFSYCSLFPKDWVFYKFSLIELWMAEGFLHVSNGRGYQKSLQDIGNDYFHCLLSNSFFQDVTKDKLGDIETVKMHDLVHDLALSVVGSHEAMILNASEIKYYASDVRRAQVVLDKEPSPNVLNSAEKLRTLFCKEEDELQLGPISNKRLRVIFSLGNISLEIPSTSFKFKHLRYLELISPTTRNVHLSSISQLYNLQVLNLRGCEDVVKILKKLGSLINLRHLNLSQSDVEVLPDSILRLTNLQTLYMRRCEYLKALPVDIGSLQQLSVLDVSGTPVKDLPDSVASLYNLRRLEFHNCKGIESLPHNLGALTQLRLLDLSDTKVKELPDSFTSNICNLEVVDLGEKCKFPKDINNWVQLRSLRYSGKTSEAIMPRGIVTLTYLRTLVPYIVMKRAVTNITCSSSIEELAALNYLRELQICNLENVRGGTEEAQRAKLEDNEDLRELNLFWKRYYGDEEIRYLNQCFNQNLRRDDDIELKFRILNDSMVLEGLQPHLSLEKLYIFGFYSPKFPKWVSGSSLSNCLPNLVTVELEHCYNCEKLPALGMLPSLKNLIISEFNSVKRLGDEFYYEQEESSIVSEDGYEDTAAAAVTTRASLFPSLVYLGISGMYKLEEWIVPPPSPYYVDCFPFLENIEISCCPLLQSLPDISSGPTIIVRGCPKIDDSGCTMIINGGANPWQ